MLQYLFRSIHFQLTFQILNLFHKFINFFILDIRQVVSERVIKIGLLLYCLIYVVKLIDLVPGLFYYISYLILRHRTWKIPLLFHELAELGLTHFRLVFILDNNCA